MKDEKILKGRLIDLAKKSYNHNIYTFSGFLGLGEQTILYSACKDIGFVQFDVNGGYPESERVVVRFGDADTLGYEEDFPITCLKIAPANARFPGEISHRDCLGAIMNLGIDRELLGDILVREDKILVFCLEKIGKFIKENLFKIRHTSVRVSDYDEPVGNITPNLEELELQLSSVRLDALVSKTFNLSREAGLAFFREEKVFLNGKSMTGNAAEPKNGDIVSVRGLGRFKYNGEVRTTKKGKIVAAVSKFV